MNISNAVQSVLCRIGGIKNITGEIINQTNKQYSMKRFDRMMQGEVAQLSGEIAWRKTFLPWLDQIEKIP